MTEYIPSVSLRAGLSRGLLSAALVEEVWAKWSAQERPSELRDNPEAVADAVLFNEVRRLVALCAAQDRSAANAAHRVRAI
jgi:hypothetical protein